MAASSLRLHLGKSKLSGAAYMDMELGSSARLLIKNRKRDENTGAANYESGNRGKFSHQPGSN